MSSYKTDQLRLTHRGKSFHFVSYEGRTANPAKQVDAMPAMWFLMTAGHRVAVMPESAGEPPDELAARFRDWLDGNVFAGREAALRDTRLPRRPERIRPRG